MRHKPVLVGWCNFVDVALASTVRTPQYPVTVGVNGPAAEACRCTLAIILHPNVQDNNVILHGAKGNTPDGSRSGNRVEIPGAHTYD